MTDSTSQSQHTTSQQNGDISPSWFSNRGYAQGVFWITLVALTSNMNDILMREASRLPAQEVTFFRYFFAVLTLLPFMLTKHQSAFKTQRYWLHGIRSILLFVAIFAWAGAVKLVPLAIMSIYALTIPLFVLPMASFFLKERVGWQRSLATLFGFSGILTIIIGSSEDPAQFLNAITLNSITGGTLLSSMTMTTTGTMMLLVSVLCFALSDIVNKKYVTKESTLSMLFYIALGTTILSAFFLPSAWITPNATELFELVILGAGGNLILFFLLKAFAATDVSSLAPYRYTELIFAGLFGFALYGEIPTFWTVIGALIIVTATASVAFYEIKIRNKS